MRRFRPVLALLAAVVLVAAALLALEPKSEPDTAAPRVVASAAPEPAQIGSAVARAEAQTNVDAPGAAAPDPRFALQPEAAVLPVDHEFKDPPKAGLMFDVGTGEILWEHHPDRELPIASLTKMLTAYMVVTKHRADEQVLISKSATKAGGSMVGVLPAGKKVRLESLLKGLLLVSGNDAAEALAEHDAGSVRRFVVRMNREADELGLQCSHFTSPHGLIDRGNHSCPRDLALLARADLSEPRIAAIARTDRTRLPFPIKGGFLDLFNNNPFIRAGDKTITGLKTGYTDAAGRCYVTTAERGGRELGVILLDAPNPLEQVPKLLDLGGRRVSITDEQRAALGALPWRGPDGERPALPLPPDEMPLRFEGGWRKRWRYVSAFGDELMICAASVQVGPASQTFWAVLDRETGEIHERTRMRLPIARGEVWNQDADGRPLEIGMDERGAVNQFESGEIRGKLKISPAEWQEAVCTAPDGDTGRYVWTRKRVAPVEVDVHIGERRIKAKMRGIEDESAGYHPRHTAWSWSAGIGTATDGRAVGWNLVEGVNDPAVGSERAIWVEGEDGTREPGPVSFDEDLGGIAFAGGERLEFSAEAERSRSENKVIVRYSYRQPFGTFTGSLDGIELASGLGVMESHDAVW